MTDFTTDFVNFNILSNFSKLALPSSTSCQI